ncbi:MAG: ribosomal-protein-alanine acetyltransferase [Pseudomonadota bacterium]
MPTWMARMKHWMHGNQHQHAQDSQLTQEQPLTLRDMRLDDVRPVHALECRVYAFPWEAEAFRDCLFMKYPCWVGEYKGSICAYGILSIAAGEAHLLNICLAPEIQGKGLGRVLLEHLAHEARTRGADVLFLEVRSSNFRAIALYQSSGFNEIGSRKGYYPAAGGREDAIVMARML